MRCLTRTIRRALGLERELGRLRSRIDAHAAGELEARDDLERRVTALEDRPAGVELIVDLELAGV